jgi:hypothetical protein
MKGAAYTWTASLLMLLGIAVAAHAAEPADVTDADRVYRNFTREAATVQPGQIRLEIRGLTIEDDGDTELDLLGWPVQSDVDEVRKINGGILDLLGSYGLGNSTELGFLIPFFIQETTKARAFAVESPDGGLVETRYFDDTTNDQDVGDVLLYGKFKRAVAEHCAVAGGLELTVPTGVERKGFGTGEVGVNPFLSSRYQKGRFGLGAHIGYQIYTGDVVDVLNYSAEAIARGTAAYALRIEVSGRLFKVAGSEFHDVVVLPGIEYNFSETFTIRPTGLANVTDEAMDWGLGLGLAYTF